jgi:hypothetical protein
VLCFQRVACWRSNGQLRIQQPIKLVLCYPQFLLDPLMFSAQRGDSAAELDDSFAIIRRHDVIISHSSAQIKHA